MDTAEITNGSASTSKSCDLLGVLLGRFILVLVLFVYTLISIVYVAITPRKEMTIWVLLKCIALVGLTGSLNASLKHNMKKHLIWELELWKWSILLMVVVCGKLISQWIVNAVFLLISWLFKDNLKVHCFAYGLKQKNRVFVWWGLVLLAWLVLVVGFGNEGGKRSEETKMILDYVTRGLISLFIGGCLWLAKDLLLWSFAISFQSKNFCERILKAKFYKFVIETLGNSSHFSVRGRLLWRYGPFNWAEEINKGKKSVVSINVFIDSISHDSNYKLKPELDNEDVVAGADGDLDNDADLATLKILTKINFLERPEGLITKENIKWLMPNDIILFYRSNIDAEVEKLFQLIKETSTKEDQSLEGIKEKDFRKWLEIVYQECYSLEPSLQNTRKGMEQLNKLAKGIVLVLILIVWLLTMKVLSTQAVALILSQFFVLTFVFGDTCKRIFEGIVFAFVTHPFDIGDRCLIEDREEELFVKEINILTTIFSRHPIDDHQDDKEKIVYPNSVLATKHICNFHRIPTPPKLDTTDLVEFIVDASTSIEQIENLISKLRDDIKKECTWIEDITAHANAFEDGDKFKMGVYLTYKDLWKDNEQKRAWKSKILLRVKRILEEVKIYKYHPEKINVESACSCSKSTR